MRSIDEIIDLWASLRPEGTEPAAYASIVDLILTIVRINGMRWKLVDGRWVNQTTNEVDQRQFNGVAECISAGTVHVGTPGVTRSTGNDLKPSEDLVRKLRRDIDAEVARSVQGRVASIARESMADIESGKTRVSDECKLGVPSRMIDAGNGVRALVPQDRDSCGRFVKRDAAIPSAPPAPSVMMGRSLPNASYSVGEGHDPSFLPPKPQRIVLPNDIINGPSIPRF